MGKVSGSIEVRGIEIMGEKVIGTSMIEKTHQTGVKELQ